MNSIDLKNRVAVITGGARGIGFACAQRFIASGAKVAIWDVSAEAVAEALAKLGDAARGFVVDVSNEDRKSVV